MTRRRSRGGNVRKVHGVVDGIRTATVRDPGGNVVGVVENPHFKLP